MEEEKLQMINEIKQIERKLYLKRSQLAAVEAMAHDIDAYKGLDTEEWNRIFSRWIEQIGQLSTGGNSVEDIRRERQGHR